MEYRNAIIKSARITDSDRGVLTAYLDLDYGSCAQGFGGYVLYLPKNFTHNTGNNVNFAGHFIWRCMEIAGVACWSKLAGKTIRVRGDYSKIEAVGHIVKDDWFYPEKDFEKMLQNPEDFSNRSILDLLKDEELLDRVAKVIQDESLYIECLNTSPENLEKIKAERIARHVFSEIRYFKTGEYSDN